MKVHKRALGEAGYQYQVVEESVNFYIVLDEHGVKVVKAKCDYGPVSEWTHVRTLVSRLVAPTSACVRGEVITLDNFGPGFTDYRLRLIEEKYERSAEDLWRMLRRSIVLERLA